MSGISQLADTAPSNDGKYFFVRNTDPVIVNNLVATTVTADELNLNGQTITASDTAIFLNGEPYGGGGGGGVATVTGSAPITVTGTAADPVVGINLSGIVQTTGAQTITGGKKFSVLPQSVVGLVPTDPEEFTNKAYVDAQVATAQPSAWSEYPATQDVNMNYFKIANCAEVSDYGTEGQGLTLSSQTGDLAISATQGDIDITCQNLILHQDLDVNGYNLTGVGDILGTTSNMLISTDTDITLQAISGNVEIDAKNLVIKSNAPAGQLVSDSILQIQTDNDMTITATDALSITAGTMTINNALSMASNKISNVTDPTLPQDAATKAYVDSRPAPAADTLANVLLAGNSAGTSDINMNGNDISSVNDITMSGVLPSITATNVLGNLTISSAATMNLGTAGRMTLASGGILSLGGATYTTLENMNINNSVISVERGETDLEFENVASINPTSGATLALGPSILAESGGQVEINTAGQNLSLVGGNTALQGTLVSINGSESISIESNASAGSPIWIQPGSANNVYVASAPPGTINDDSSVLNVDSTTRGMYIPRLTSVQRLAIVNPQAGLICYDTTDNAIYVYTTSWIKTVLANSANELVTSLSGLASGVPQKQLTGFQSVTTGLVNTDAIAPIDPLIQPYISIAGDVSMPDNSRIDFGAVDIGDGTIKATQNLNLQADNSVIFTTPTIAFNVTGIEIVSDNYIQLNADSTISLNSQTISLNQSQGLLLPTMGGFGSGSANDVIVSQGPGLPARWQPAISTAAIVGNTPLLVRSGEGIVSEGTLIFNNTLGVLV